MKMNNTENEKIADSVKDGGIRKIKANDILLIGAILLAALAGAVIMLLTRSEGDSVTVTVDGKLFAEYSLSENRTVEIKNGEGFNILVIENGRAYVREASCPDGICSSHRPISYSGQSIICLPNKVVIEVKAKQADGPDVIT